MSEKEYARFNNDPVPKKVQSIYENRLRQFTDEGQYRSLNLAGYYDYDRTNEKPNVTLEVYSVPGINNRPSFKETMDMAKWRNASIGEMFGPSWSTHWFKVNIRVPKEWRNADSVIWNWDCGNEGLIYTADGHAVVGLSGEERKEWIIPKEWQKDGNWHLFYVETSCNSMAGDGSPPDMNKYFRLNTADLVWPNLEARALHIDFWIISDAAREFPNDSWQKHKARDVANRIMNAFDPENVDESVKKGRELAKEYLGDKVNSTTVYDSDKQNLVYALGNCHIDTAWLWPYGETHRKVGRSWATQLDLIDRYPEYKFVASQVQQFKWLSQDYPDTFERVKKAVKKGSFIPIGGSWVENDTNMPTGESLVRQFLLGQRFFQQHFNMRTNTFWLPDTFGYSPQIPQICRLAGIDRFLTQKLSWNNINTFPNSSFNWVALDGSQVMCHMPPDNTYTAEAHFGDVSRSLNQHKNLEVDQKGMLLFGHGDGGGGPTPEMLEKLRRCRGLSDTVDLLPRVKLGVTVDDFYNDLLKKTNNGKDLVTWVGELYLEFHRGTYTTQAAIKKGNRTSEVLMHDIEFFATLASLINENYRYPTKEIDDLWEDVCLNQFHDVLPGSGIEMIYEDARAIYKSIEERGTKLRQEALDHLGISTEPSPDCQDIVALNTMPWGRSELISVEKQLVRKGMLAQTFSSGETLIRVETEGSGIARPVITSSGSLNGPCASAVQIGKGVYALDNGKLRVVIEGGALTSIWDYENDREVLAEGQKGNQFVIFDDQPLSFPAWDTELYSLETRREVSQGTEITILENGPLTASVQVKQTISSKSSIISTISLDAYIPPTSKKSTIPDVSYIKFDCHVEWHETYKFLKVEFPVDVHNDYAAYETQFGYHKRPTHYNTSWDVAKFEVSAHKWADLSDYSYGVALLNDCKYGYSVHGNMMRLSLLRSPKSPDAHADMGNHHFRYALLPHKGSLNHEVIRTAYNFNNPLAPYYIAKGVIDVDSEESLQSISLVGDESIILSNVKRFEDDQDVSRGLLPVRGTGPYKSIIVRAYDSLGGKSRGKIVYKHLGKKIVKAFKTNILEDDLEELVVHDSKVEISLRPFEVATYRLEIE